LRHPGAILKAGTGLLLAALCAQPAFAAAPWSMDAQSSRLRFTAVQAGGEFDGEFRRFDAGIRFDPADLAGSRFTVTVDTASVDTKDADRDGILRGPEFFDVARWPSARFETTGFTALGATRFEASGRLTMRDVTREVRLPFEFVIDPGGGAASMKGGTRVQRLDFGIGQGEWQDTTWVGNEVGIAFELRLRKE
jgi:polyisoprenoid-binding protein YceI